MRQRSRLRRNLGVTGLMADRSSVSDVWSLTCEIHATCKATTVHAPLILSYGPAGVRCATFACNQPSTAGSSTHLALRPWDTSSADWCRVDPVGLGAGHLCNARPPCPAKALLRRPPHPSSLTYSSQSRHLPHALFLRLLSDALLSTRRWSLCSFG